MAFSLLIKIAGLWLGSQSKTILPFLNFLLIPYDISLLTICCLIALHNYPVKIVSFPEDYQSVIKMLKYQQYLSKVKLILFILHDYSHNGFT